MAQKEIEVDFYLCDSSDCEVESRDEMIECQKCGGDFCRAHIKVFYEVAGTHEGAGVISLCNHCLKNPGKDERWVEIISLSRKLEEIMSEVRVLFP
ncbi:MAG: hypothetical protein ACTSRU_11580 [Candidatus Hodarchaeales archaeon]